MNSLLVVTRFFVIILFLTCFTTYVKTQTILPDGQPEIGNFHLPGYGFVQATSNTIYLNGDRAYDKSQKHPGTTIKSVKKKPEKNDRILVELSDGSTIVLEIVKTPTYQQINEHGGKVQTGTSVSFRKALGDAVYVLTSSGVYVSRDSLLTTFQIDSAGLNSAYLWDIALDTAQYVYAATTKGLYKQHPDSSVWHHVDAFTLTNNLYSIFVDRINRIFLGGNGGGTYMSSDNGTTWILDSAGVGNQSASTFGDDAFGNIYGAFVGLYKSAGGTQPWTRIDQSILNTTVNPVTINDIEGDTTLYLATSFGGFQSTDQGQTWLAANDGIKAESFYGFAKIPSGKIYISTGLGIFSQNPNDTAWQKVYPTSGYRSGLSIQRDGIGNLYTTIRNPTNSNGADLNFISTDGGTTWTADTAGISSMGFGSFYVDEAGGQHVATSQYGSGFPTKVYKKDPGSDWAIDTVGFPVFNYSFSSSIASNKHGYLFVSGSYSHLSVTYPKVLKRPIGGGTWVPDTAGMPASVPYFNFMFPDVNGNMFGLLGTQLYHQESGTWVKKSFPSNATGTYHASIDSAGAIFIARQQYVSGSGYNDVGISVSTDNGTTWSDLTSDTVAVQVLASFGDTTYFVTSKGITALTSGGIVSSVSLQAASGWNMLSVPSVVGDFHKTVLYPAATSFAYSYNGGYQNQTILQNGLGYWLKFPSITSINITGAFFQKETLAVALGWNMIGGPSAPAQTMQVNPVGTTVTSFYYGYAGSLGYYQEDTLKPGLGYWVKTSAAGQLILNGSENIPKQSVQSGGVQTLEHFTITDASGRQQMLYIGTEFPKQSGIYEMPPTPPSGIFDARFASQRIAEFVIDESPKEFRILLTSAQYPITIGSELRSFNASIGTNRKDIPLPTNGRIVITEPQSNIILKISNGQDLPKRFALAQNYPNPFNPTTNLQFAIANVQFVTLKIYDLLGREVTTVVNEMKQPGFYTVKWDANEFASGIYFYRLTAGTFVDTKKLVLIK